MKILNCILIAIIISACAPIYVSHDYEKAANFSDYKTYNFFSNIESGLNQLDEKRLVKALDNKLAAMGLQKIENPSFYIDIKSDVFETQSANTVGVGVGGGTIGSGGGVSIGIPLAQNGETKQITVEFVDQTEIGLFWQATSQCVFKPNKNPEKRNDRFIKIVEKMLSKYPPKKN